ncbi:molecular chaperone DnaK, partial [bacterium]
VHILQGERPRATDNKSLGRFHLSGIPPMPARMPQIEVTFDIDANGIVNVSAQEKGTGSKQSITITGAGNLNRNEIERMVAEAEANAESDRKAQDLIELKNKSESLIYNTEKTLKDAGDKIDEALRGSATEKIEALRRALQGDQEFEIQASFNALESDSHQIAEKLYAQASSEADASDGGKTEDVAEATNFTEEK